ncbi:MAG TPA: hypothetical protein VFO55_08830, partial [Gemmatimonadaceae bacterium]|nr:hypothetical protein [Gemmatimonadaceae bacterium]
KDVVHRSRKDGTEVLLSGVHMQPRMALTGSALLAELGEENVLGNIDLAVERASVILSEGKERASPSLRSG